eukprot:gene12082-biopygen15467
MPLPYLTCFWRQFYLHPLRLTPILCCLTCVVARPAVDATSGVLGCAVKRSHRSLRSLVERWPQTAGCSGARFIALLARSARSSSAGPKQRGVGVRGWPWSTGVGRGLQGVDRGVPGGGRGWVPPYLWGGCTFQVQGGGAGPGANPHIWGGPC